MDGNLWGSDLSYNDLKSLQNAFDGTAVKLEAPAQVDGQTTQVLLFAPKPGSSSKYTAIRVYLDEKSCLSVKTELLAGAEVLKLLTASPKDFKQSGTRWYPGEILVQTPKAGTRTRVKVTGLSIGDSLPARYFHPTAFYQ